MERAQREAFEKKAAQAFRSYGAVATDVSLCGSSFVATFKTQGSARKGAAAMMGIIKGIKVWESRDDLQGVKASIANRNTYKVWRIGGQL